MYLSITTAFFGGQMYETRVSFNLLMTATFCIGALTIYSYFEKGCRKKCTRDNPER